MTRFPRAVLIPIFLMGGLVVSPSASRADDAETPPLNRAAHMGGYPDWVMSVALSPDGKLAAAGSYDVVKVWELGKEADAKTLKTRSAFARALTFSPDGSALFVGGYQQIQVWNVESFEKTKTIKGHRGYVTDLKFSPDRKTLLSASEDKTVRFWNSVEGSKQSVMETFEFPILGVAWSPNGKQIATAEGDETRLSKPGSVKIWNAESQELVQELTPHESAATSVLFSPDGSRLLSGGYDEKVNIHEVETGKPFGFFGGHSRPINSLALVADGRLVASGSGGRAKGKNEIKVWDPTDGTEVASVEAHTGKITKVASSPGADRLLSSSQDETVAIWDTTSVLSYFESDTPAATETEKETDVIRIGIIGLDTSHAIAFTKLLNAEDPPEALSGCRVVVAYPHGSPDIESSKSRIPQYTEDIKRLGVEIVDSIDDLIAQVDAVLLETNDGRPHLEQVIPVLKAGKRVFVDKPVAGSLTDAMAIYAAAKKFDVPIFSSSSLRWMTGAQEARNGEHGDIVGCDTYSPCSLEPTHPDLFWYGIHGVEGLFTVMGTGCQTVQRTSLDNVDVVVGTWEGGRIGTFRGLREGKRGYGGVAYGTKSVATLGPHVGYGPLLERVVHYFRTGEVPVTPEETLEIYAFMEAADESKRQQGAAVKIDGVMKTAREAAVERLAKLLND